MTEDFSHEDVVEVLFVRKNARRDAARRKSSLSRVEGRIKGKVRIFARGAGWVARARLRAFLENWRKAALLQAVADAASSSAPSGDSPKKSEPAPAAVLSGPQAMDPWLWFAAIALTGIGLVAIYSASGWHAYLATQNQILPSFDGLLRKQAIFVALGLLGALVLAKSDYRLARRFGGWFLFFTLAALLYTAFFGPQINGARRWVKIAGMSLQPSEFAKVALVACLARMLARKGELVQSFTRGYVPLLLTAGLTMGLVVLGKDLGLTVLLGLMTMAMLFVAGARWVYMVATVLAVLPVVWGLIVAQPYRLKRIADYFSDGGHQVQQSLIAIGSGGIWGLGLGQGRQKLGPLPENHNDFILASWAEETGLFGVGVVIALYLLLIWRGYRAVSDAPDRYGAYLAAGLTAMFGGQALLNMAVVFKIVPAKGIALPFLSSGGSSMLSSMIGVGLLLSVSRRAAPSRWGDLRRSSGEGGKEEKPEPSPSSKKSRGNRKRPEPRKARRPKLARAKS